MQLLLDIPESKRPGIAAARALYNASLPPAVQDGEEQVQVDTMDGEPIYESRPRMVPNPALHATDEAYLVWVVNQAVDGYNTLVVVPPPPPPPPGTVNGVPQEVSARQAHEELAAQGLHDLLEPTNPAKSAVQACINAIPDLVMRGKIHNLFHKSTVFKRSQPEVIALWTNPAPYGLAKTLPALDQTFTDAAAR